MIELLVSVALFTVVMTVSVGTLLALVNANQKAQSMKSVTNNFNFALDSMSRAIRTGRSYLCSTSIPLLSLPDGTMDCSNGERGLVLTDDHGQRLAYRFFATGQRIERRIGDSGSWEALTAPEVKVVGMRFYVTGSDPGDTGDTVQPTVTISIRGYVGAKESTDSVFKIQTTLTQWLLDQ